MQKMLIKCISLENSGVIHSWLSAGNASFKKQTTTTTEEQNRAENQLFIIAFYISSTQTNKKNLKKTT